MVTKVTTMIVNETEQPLRMKVGGRNCFCRLASVKIGGEYAMELCMDWTYQEFMVEGTSDARKRLFVNSDECCDYERITIKESDGKLLVVRVPRKRVAKKNTTWRFWL